MDDIIIIGAGCAGLTAAIYAARAGKRVRVLESEGIGGQIASSPRVENYPGIKEISGMAFSENLYAQAEALGVKTDYGRAVSLIPGEPMTVVTSDGRLQARSVILATGTKHRMLGLEREKELRGRGVSYCAVCDGAFFKNADVAVAGGGSAALQSAEYLSGVCRKVYLIHRRDRFRGEEKLAERVSAKANIELVLNANAVRLTGGDTLAGVVVKDKFSGAERELPVKGFFVAIGQEPGSGAFSDVVKLDEQGYIAAGEDCRTSVPGVFAAGDCRTKSVRQLTTAAADGTVAALAACAWADEHPGE